MKSVFLGRPYSFELKTRAERKKNGFQIPILHQKNACYERKSVVLFNALRA